MKTWEYMVVCGHSTGIVKDLNESRRGWMGGCSSRIE
jgi:hypothetical protein